jgi:hypothetical protein
VIRAEQDLPGTEGGRGEGWGRGQGGEMSQRMYAHVNKLKKTYILRLKSTLHIILKWATFF